MADANPQLLKMIEDVAKALSRHRNLPAKQNSAGKPGPAYRPLSMDRGQFASTENGGGPGVRLAKPAGK